MYVYIYIHKYVCTHRHSHLLLHMQVKTYIYIHTYLLNSLLYPRPHHDSIVRFLGAEILEGAGKAMEKPALRTPKRLGQESNS